MDELRQQMKEFQKNFNPQDFKLDQKQLDEWKQQMDQLRKQMDELKITGWMDPV